VSPSPARIATNDVFRPIAALLSGKVLNVGGSDGKKAGGGKTYKDFFPKASQYLALDLCPGPGVDLVADAKHIPLADASCDVILCMYMLEHEKEYKQVLSEMARVASCGAVLLLAVPSYHRYHASLRCNDYWRWTRDAIVSDLLEAGFYTDRAMYAGNTVDLPLDSRLSYLGTVDDPKFEVVIVLAKRGSK